MLNEGLEVLGTSQRLKPTEKDNGVFAESAVEEIGFPSTLKKIESYAFWNCKKLKCVTLPEGLETIGEYSFSNSWLKEVTVPSTVVEIMENAFYRT